MALDTKSREFQYKLLNRFIATSAFLHKIGIVSSSLCSLCDVANETLEQFIFYLAKKPRDFRLRLLNGVATSV